jgi:hypothetical protein
MAEKIAVIFYLDPTTAELSESGESKKGAMDEETDNDKKTEDTDKYLKSNNHLYRPNLAISNHFGIGDTPLLLHPYHEHDPKPPKSA